MGSSVSSVDTDVEDDVTIHTLSHPVGGWPYAECFVLRDMLRHTGYEDRFKLEWTDDAVPRLHIGDGTEVLTSADAILRFVGRLTHLYPVSCAVSASVVDEWIDLARTFDETSFNEHTASLEKDLEYNEWLGSFESPSLADFVWVSHLKCVEEGKLSTLLTEYCQRLDDVVRDSSEADAPSVESDEE